MLEAFLQHAGLPKQWLSSIMSFLRGPIGFLVGRKVSPKWIKSSEGIHQGDDLSPALFALLTALLCQKLQQRNCMLNLSYTQTTAWFGSKAVLRRCRLRYWNYRASCMSMDTPQD